MAPGPVALLTRRPSFVSGSVIPGSFTVGLDPEMLKMLSSSAGMSERFVADIYRTEKWTKLNVSSRVVHNPTTSLGS